MHMKAALMLHASTQSVNTYALTRKVLRRSRHMRLHRSVGTALCRRGAAHSLFRNASTSMRPPTAVVMMNMGGPATLDKVQPFLTNLFTDNEIIKLGAAQPWLGPFIAKRRTPKIQAQYKEIGGGSPIGKWTDKQGEAMCRLLDERSPATAPHKHYVMFRYADPMTEDCLRAMQRDGVRRAVAFSQYPQWSCTTSGSSYNNLWRELRRLDMGGVFEWSVLDRWPTHPGFIKAVAKRVKLGLEAFDSDEAREQAVIVFTAHSVPMMVVNRGDAYTGEVAATVSAVMNELRQPADGMGVSNRHVLAWQSKVGFLPWMGPSTSDVLAGLGKQGHKHVLAVPIAFTSDHIETLYEIDIEYAEEAAEAGIEQFRRSPSLNDEPLLAEAMADIVGTHLESGELHTPSYALNCSGCVNPTCRSIMDPVGGAEYTRMRDAANGISTPNEVAQLQ